MSLSQQKHQVHPQYPLNCSTNLNSLLNSKDGKGGLGKLYFRGIITPIAWDKNDCPIQFSLYEFNGNEYPLKALHSSISLHALNNREVIVLGSTMEDNEGNEVLYYTNVTAVARKKRSRSSASNVEFIEEHRCFLPTSIGSSVFYSA